MRHCKICGRKVNVESDGRMSDHRVKGDLKESKWKPVPIDYPLCQGSGTRKFASVERAMIIRQKFLASMSRHRTSIEDVPDFLRKYMFKVE